MLVSFFCIAFMHEAMNPRKRQNCVLKFGYLMLATLFSLDHGFKGMEYLKKSRLPNSNLKDVFKNLIIN